MNKEIIWKYTNFYKYNSDDGIVSEKLCVFLNENDIEDFKIIQMRNNYIEIVYKKL